MGLGYKLAPEPLLILVVRTGLIGLRVRTTEVTSFEAATPPQSGGSIFTIQNMGPTPSGRDAMVAAARFSAAGMAKQPVSIGRKLTANSASNRPDGRSIPRKDGARQRAERGRATCSSGFRSAGTAKRAATKEAANISTAAKK
jgi:hypothetical protein